MRICLLGDFAENLDEGYKNTSHHLARELEKSHQVIRLDGKRIGTTQFWHDALSANPQIIHVISQPTDQSYIITRLLGSIWPKAKTVISALRPESYFQTGKASSFQRNLIRLTHPNLTLAQSPQSEAVFQEIGCPVAQLPGGVTLERFEPAAPEHKRELRAKYGFDPERSIILHVGHLQPERNLQALEPLQRTGLQVVIAGSLYMGTNTVLIKQLEEIGFYVLKGYQPHIEELYQLSDCYVFPTRPGKSLTMPLSILEAMACNLPIVTTRFDGLQFKESSTFRFIAQGDSILSIVQETLATATAPHTREMVSAYSWESVISQLQTYYQGLLAS